MLSIKIKQVLLVVLMYPKLRSVSAVMPLMCALQPLQLLSPAAIMTHCTHHPPQRCDGLMSEKEELLVQSMAQQGRIKELEEERNRLQEERSIFCSQLQKASEGHKIMAEQLKLHESDFEKERAQREKLLAEYDTLKTKNISLQQEKNAVRAHVLYMYLTFSARVGIHVQCKMKCVRLLMGIHLG